MKSWIFKDKDDAGAWVEHPPADLPAEPVQVEVTHSGLNYKDALSITRSAPISRRFPMVPGIDLVGTVIEDASNTFRPGDRVIATGHGLGENHWGAYTTQSSLKPEWLMKLPDEISNEHAAAIGTAGLTAAMAINALERHGITPQSGKMVVTGSTGGVGSFALALLAADGYRIVAVTGRPSEGDYLLQGGAAEVLDRAQFEGDARPLGKELWSAGIDVTGGKILANLLSNTAYGGAIAACGLTSSMSLPTSVAPFILRGVALLGVDSVMASSQTRMAAWTRIKRSLGALNFARIIRNHHFNELPELASGLLAQRLRGRIVLHW